MTTKTPERTTIEAFEMEVVDRADVAHLWRVIAKWRAVVIAGVVFVLAATLALLALTPPDYEADTTLLFDEPALIASGQQGLDTAQKLLNLMPTYAAEATGDPVLELVRERLGSNASLDDLRARISATPVRSALAIQIKAHDAHAGVAQRL